MTPTLLYRPDAYAYTASRFEIRKHPRMRSSQYLITTHRETPADAEIVSHQLMLRAGLVRKLSSGLYTWMPIGLRVLKKVEKVVREEMEAAGALELAMPMVQPGELWQESGRWEKYGPELLRITDRHQRDFCLGPTHEEVITDIVRNEISSYKQLPINFFQIQNKVRDEIRPRFGVMRAREFLMKDAYSFHIDEASLEETYQVMHEAYSAIFTRLGLEFRPVLADNGSIGGSKSHEFHVLADSGEDSIAFSDGSDYAANVELAVTLPSSTNPQDAEQSPGPLTRIDTPGIRTIAQLCDALEVAPETTAKTLIVKGVDGELIALVVRGDHELNPIKAQKLPQVANPLCMASEEEARAAIGASFGSLGPVGLPLPVIVDYAAVRGDLICGANIDDVHYTGVNLKRDVSDYTTADLRFVKEGDPSPDGKGRLQICRGIEVGHIFQLGSQYSEAMQATVLNQNGKASTLEMGCYGIGVSRIVAAAIEQNHDERGICWPAAMAPFQLAIVPLNMHKSAAVAEAALALYKACLANGIEVLLDDRDERPGVKFSDVELLGVPHRVVIGDRSLKEGGFEYQARSDSQASSIPQATALEFLRERIG